MLHGMRLFLFLILLLAASGARAETAPRCTPVAEGQVACIAGKLCACRFHPGGSLTGRPAGTRWDCGTLRPACGPAAPEAGQPADRTPPPPAFPPPYLSPAPPMEWR